VGVFFGTQKVNTLAFSDDLVLIASTEQDLEQLFDSVLNSTGSVVLF